MASMFVCVRIAYSDVDKTFILEILHLSWSYWE